MVSKMRCRISLALRMTLPRHATSSRGSRPRLPPGPEPAVQWPLQYQPRLADAAGDAAGYTETVIRDRKLAEALDARGHLAVAQQLAAPPSGVGHEDSTWHAIESLDKRA